MKEIRCYAERPSRKGITLKPVCFNWASKGINITEKDFRLAVPTGIYARYGMLSATLVSEIKWNLVKYYGY